MKNKYNQITILFILFPFISFRLNNLDLQPYAFTLSFLSIIFLDKLNKKIIYFGLYALLSFFVAIFSTSSFESLARSVVTSFSPLVFAIFTYRILTEGVKLSNYLFYSIVVYFACGLFQYIIDVNLFNFLVLNRTTENRGVTSLTPEPSMYGIYLIMTYAAYIIINKDGPYKNIFLYIIVVTQVLLIAQSSLSIIILGISSFISFLFIPVNKFKTLVCILSAVSLMILIDSFYLFDFGLKGRVLSVFSNIFTFDYELILIDESIRARYCHIAVPIHAFYSDFGMPHGISNFNNELARLDLNSPCYKLRSDDNSKIMSGFGQIIYENGLFSILLIVAIFIIVKNSRVVNYKKIFCSAALILSQVSSGTLALPLFGLIIGIFLYKGGFKYEVQH